MIDPEKMTEDDAEAYMRKWKAKDFEAFTAIDWYLFTLTHCTMSMPIIAFISSLGKKLSADSRARARDGFSSFMRIFLKELPNSPDPNASAVLHYLIMHAFFLSDVLEQDILDDPALNDPKHVHKDIVDAVRVMKERLTVH